ncbi:putative acetyltransferase [Candidatus Sulfobium mesophilum]|uniref:Putative acetyltransferase n=1 Tax=Candidatus Sulfobium mesophilum TaxID=2016548 RepID=A0A2U3QF30_9BACT|nr:putative acetyltransferase [Candidatus Sulfobium mesophilum]
MIRELAWDSQLFKRKIGRLTRIPSDDVLQKLIRRALKENYHYLTCRFNLNRVSEIQLLEKYGFYVSDLGVVWERKVDPLSGPVISVRGANLNDAPTLKKISSGLFKDSRFHNDPFFTYDEAERLYQAWIVNSLNDTDIRTFLVEKKGFITCKRLSKNKGDIPLVGVIAGEQGKGIGSALIAEVMDWFGKAGVKTVMVRTQAYNVKAMNFYKGLDFRVKYVDVTMGKILRGEEKR